MYYSLFIAASVAFVLYTPESFGLPTGDQSYRGTADEVKNETEKVNVILDASHVNNNNSTPPEHQQVLDIAKRTLYHSDRNMPESQLAGIVGSAFLTMANDIKDDHLGVCKAIESKFNIKVKDINVCPWNYTCTYNRNRYPHYMLQANCLYSQHKPAGSCDNKQKICIPISARFTVLMATEVADSKGTSTPAAEGSADDTAGEFDTDTMSFKCGSGTDDTSLCEEKEVEIIVGCKEVPS